MKFLHLECEFWVWDVWEKIRFQMYFLMFQFQMIFFPLNMMHDAIWMAFFWMPTLNQKFILVANENPQNLISNSAILSSRQFWSTVVIRIPIEICHWPSSPHDLIIIIRSNGHDKILAFFNWTQSWKVFAARLKSNCQKFDFMLNDWSMKTANKIHLIK